MHQVAFGDDKTEGTQFLSCVLHAQREHIKSMLGTCAATLGLDHSSILIKFLVERVLLLSVVRSGRRSTKVKCKARILIFFLKKKNKE